MAYSQASDINDIIQKAERIVILIADNPDGDSVGSALALEHILSDMGKEPLLYCGVDIPTYLRYLPGWDRIERDLPVQFDASIVVDTSVYSLFETLATAPAKKQLWNKPCVVIDHHAVEPTIPFMTVLCNFPAVATGEVIYELAQTCHWPLSLDAKHMLAVSILADSLGLMTEATSARSIHIIAELVESGVKLPALEYERRLLMRKSPELIKYKGVLLQRVAYHAEGRIATVDIPWEEIQKYSPLYNPSMLVIEDMRMTTDVQVVIAFKIYDDGKVTGKIRTAHDTPIAAKLAAAFGGGGHDFASGFKTIKNRPFAELKQACIAKATELLDGLSTAPPIDRSS